MEVVGPIRAGPDLRPGVDEVMGCAARRDVEAEQRDARAQERDDALATDPSSRTSAEVGREAAADRAAAEEDRRAAAEDRDALRQMILAPLEPHGDIKVTHREAEVLECLGRALTNAEIAQDLHISVNSVKTHLRLLYKKLDVASRAQAALWLRTHGTPGIAPGPPPSGPSAGRRRSSARRVRS